MIALFAQLRCIASYPGYALGMKTLSCGLFAVLVLLAGAHASHAGATIEGSDVNISHDCATDPDVSISSASGTVNVTGVCNSVQITGASNTVTIASAKKVAVTGASNEVAVVEAGKIVVAGASNTVTYQKGMGKAKAPKVSKAGAANSVKKVKPGA
jgi:hypothetical protein